MAVTEGKIVLIGAGMVGSAILSSIISMNVVSEVAVIDMNENKAKGEVLDAIHTTAFAYSTNVNIHVGCYEDCRNAEIIVFSAGPSIKPGGADDRMALLKQNVAIVENTMKEITKYTKEAIVLIVSNPLDILVYAAQKAVNYPKDKIFGTGTLLDSARFRQMVGHLCGIDSKNVHGYVLGEHGRSAFIAWNLVNVGGVPLDKLQEVFHLDRPIDKEKLLEDVKGVGIDIVQLKGYTNSGIALSVARVIKCIRLNEKSILPVSTVVNGAYGIQGVALSLPCIISKHGVSEVVEVALDDKAKQDLQECVDKLSEIQNSIA
jgi:L-lactate dehydrogenase